MRAYGIIRNEVCLKPGIEGVDVIGAPLQKQEELVFVGTKAALNQCVFTRGILVYVEMLNIHFLACLVEPTRNSNPLSVWM